MVNALGRVGSYVPPPHQAGYGFSYDQRQAGHFIYDMLAGTQAQKRKNEMCFETDATRKKGKLKRRAVTNQAPTSILKDCRTLLGSDTIEAQEQIGTPLSMKLGRREYVNPIPSFLSNLSGTGTVRSEWNGFLQCGVDARVGFMTLFRHRLAATTDGGASETAPYTSAAYPSASVVGDILVPTNPNALVIPIHAKTNSISPPTAPTLTLTGSTYDHSRVDTDGKQVSEVCWAPLNRPDYEDMSWNLNHLRLGQPSTAYNSALGDTGYPDAGAKAYSYLTQDHALLVPTNHRKMSNIDQNNVRSAGTASSFTLGAPYKYNMVFNYGTVHYYFMNKESNGCKVELIVYKHKKNHYAPTLSSDSQAAGLGGNSNSTGYALDSIKGAIGVGYMSTKAKLLGTDDLSGRTPTTEDIWSNPNFPLLPKLRQTTQSEMPWTEVMRNVFIIPAGGRRAVDIQLPGEVYNPSSVVLARQPASEPTGTVGVWPEAAYGLWDEHTYGVVMTVNGIPVTRDIHQADGKIYRPSGDPNDPWVSGNYHLRGSDYLSLDCHCAANLQYYCAYTEHISACVYQHSKKNQIFVRGDAINPPVVAGTLVPNADGTQGYYVGKDLTEPAVTVAGVTILPVAQTVRTTQVRSTTSGIVTDSGLTHTVSGTGAKSSSIAM